MKQLLSIWLLVVGLTVIGCGTSGKEFDNSLVDDIVNGQTTQREVETMFGNPFKKGIQNGKEVWIYEHNQYKTLSLFGDDTSKDMVIIFDDSKVVKTHLYMTNQGSQK
jgi:hypothetical protein